jgi:response regulator NasT
MTRSLRIIVADDEARIRDFLWHCVENLGHVVVSGARTGQELIDRCREYCPDLVISDIKMPDKDGIEAADEIYRFAAVPVILVSAFHDDELIVRASGKHILAYLVKPIKESDLGPAIAVAMQRSREFQELRTEAQNLKQALDHRKIIERAKGIVMQRTGLSEPDAFRRLQKLASSRNQKLIDIAGSIVTAEEVMSDSSPSTN